MVISQGGMVISRIGLSCGLVHVFFSGEESKILIRFDWFAFCIDN